MLRCDLCVLCGESLQKLLLLKGIQNFGMFGESSRLLFRENELPIFANFKHTPAGFNEFCIAPYAFLNLLCQTGSFGKIVSDRAICDGYVHKSPLFGYC
jgi:hypothetical protein